MFFGLLPVTEILLFIGMIASWFYLSIGVIGMKLEKTGNLNEDLSVNHQQTKVTVENASHINYQLNFISCSKNNHAVEPIKISSSQWSTACILIFPIPIGSYGKEIIKNKTGRAPPVLIANTYLC
jgi:hypothetical protein